MPLISLRKTPGVTIFVAKLLGFLPFFQAAIIALAASVLANVAQAQQVLREPSDDSICLLYYHIANQPPPISQFAQTVPAVQNANEFNQPKALADETSKLNAQYNSLSGTDTIIVTINMQFDTYDSQLGQYELTGFADGFYVPYTCFGGTQLHLSFDNNDDASAWVLPAPKAEDVLNRNGGQRYVKVSTTIKLVSVNPGAPGDPLELVGDVRKVRISGAYNNAPLGQYDVPSN